MVDGLGTALGGMISLVVFIAVLAVLVAVNLLLVTLKLCGVLILSWWWLAGFLPAVFLLLIFIAGIMKIFEN